MVQRSQRLLSRCRPASDNHAHRFQQILPRRGRLGLGFQSRGSTCRHRRSCRRLFRQQSDGARIGQGIFRARSRSWRAIGGLRVVSRSPLAAKPVAATGLADKAAWFHRCDVTSWWEPLSLGVVLVGVVLVLSTFRDYGVTWDEDVHNWYGNFVLDYYLSLFGDKTALHWRDLYNYGAGFELIAS